MNRNFSLGLMISAALLAAGPAMAQASRFDGFSVGADIDFKSTTIGMSGIEGVGMQSIIPAVKAEYSASLGQSSSIAFGARYDLSKTTIVDISGIKLREQDHYSVYAAPGFMLGDSTLGYFKIAAHSAKLSATGLAETLSINGLGYAVGIKAKLANNLFGTVEVGRIAYNDQGILNATVETGTTVGSVGLSFSFH